MHYTTDPTFSWPWLSLIQLSTKEFSPNLRSTLLPLIPMPRDANVAVQGQDLAFLSQCSSYAAPTCCQVGTNVSCVCGTQTFLARGPVAWKNNFSTDHHRLSTSSIAVGGKEYQVNPNWRGVKSCLWPPGTPSMQLWGDEVKHSAISLPAQIHLHPLLAMHTPVWIGLTACLLMAQLLEGWSGSKQRRSNCHCCFKLQGAVSTGSCNCLSTSKWPSS